MHAVAWRFPSITPEMFAGSPIRRPTFALPNPVTSRLVEKRRLDTTPSPTGR
jgi:hypothetical protein